MDKIPLEPITARTIVNALSKAFSDKRSVSKETLLDGAMKLSVLALDEIEKLVKMKQGLAQLKVDMMGGQEKRNISEIEIRVEAVDEYLEMKKQEAFVKQIDEIVKVAKLSARLNEFSG